MMWQWWRWLIASSMLASVVDLPEPVGPVTRTRPCGRSTHVDSTAGRPEVVERRDLDRDQPEGQCGRTPLVERVPAETCDALPVEREVDLLLGDELVPELTAQHPANDPPGVVGHQRRFVEPRERAVDSDERRCRRGQEEVGAVVVGEETKEPIDGTGVDFRHVPIVPVFAQSVNPCRGE